MSVCASPAVTVAAADHSGRSTIRLRLQSMCKTNIRWCTSWGAPSLCGLVDWMHSCSNGGSRQHSLTFIASLNSLEHNNTWRLLSTEMKKEVTQLEEVFNSSFV